VNNRVVCLSAKCKEKEIIETPQALVYCYPLTAEIASCGFSWSLWQDFKRLSNWADIVHYQFPWPFADILALTRQNRNKPYIVSYQSDIVRQKSWYTLYSPLMSKFLDNAAAVVATSPKYIKSSLVLSSLKTPAELIPNGINGEPAFESYRLEYNQYYKTYGDEFFLFIGVFRYYKGLQYLLEAAKQTEKPILIVGDGPEANALHCYAKENKLDNVFFLGHVNNKQKYALIALAKALILPASERSEAYGMVLLEASRQGTPMITTELGSGTSYININGETGIVVAAKNTEKLSEAIMFFAEGNVATISKMADEAKERFNNCFTADIMASAYLKLYQKVLMEVKR